MSSPPTPPTPLSSTETTNGRIPFPGDDTTICATEDTDSINEGIEKWAGPLAIFSSNLSFALEGPGRCSDDYAVDAGEAPAGDKGEEAQGAEDGLGSVDGMSHRSATGQRRVCPFHLVRRTRSIFH